MSDLTIRKGKTFTHSLRYAGDPVVFKPITNITRAAPCRLTVTDHGMLDGWPASVESVGGMVEINIKKSTPTAKEFRKMKVVDANTLEISDLNSLGYSAYTSGGVIRYYTPRDLTGKTPRMVVKDKAGGTVIASTDVDHIADGALEIVAATDIPASRVSFTFPDETTAAIVQKKAVFEAELEYAGGTVSYLDSGTITFVTEIAT